MEELVRVERVRAVQLARRLFAEGRVYVRADGGNEQPAELADGYLGILVPLDYYLEENRVTSP